ncbi:MAG: hypothetical protein ABI665_02535 [Vicinamibacterales bacterium]
MRIRPLVFVGAALVCTLAFAHAASAQDPVGVWKMNPAKSKYSPGPAPKTATITTTAVAGGRYKAVNEAVPATGAPTKSEVTWAFDGKDHPVTGNPNADTQAYTKVDARHYTVVAKKGGKVTVTTKVELAADGKSRTATQAGTDAQGKPVNNMIWYDKQ